jgi:hypothetical protein
MRFQCHKPIVSVAPLSGVQLESNRVMLLKFRSDSLLIINPCFVDHSWGGFRTYPFLYTCVGSWYLEMCGTYDVSLLNNFFASRMADEGRGWMYGGWKKSGAHTREWMNKTQEFINHAFSILANQGVKCPCSRCRNAICEDKRTLIMHLCKFGFMSGYEV